MKTAMGRRAAIGLIALSTALLGCMSVASFRLPVPANQARSTFAPLTRCAAAQGLTSAEHASSLNVRYDPSTWMQFMIQNDHFNLLISVSHDVPEGQRSARTTSAKQKGDELLTCATAALSPSTR